MPPRPWLHETTPGQIVPGDGSCLFHCITAQLRLVPYYSTLHVAQLRSALAGFIMHNPSYLMDDGRQLGTWIWDAFQTNVNVYANRLRQWTYWAGEVEVPLLSIWSGIAIDVYVRERFGYRLWAAYDGADPAMDL